jgi:hypothetical protein
VRSVKDPTQCKVVLWVKFAIFKKLKKNKPETLCIESYSHQFIAQNTTKKIANSINLCIATPIATGCLPVLCFEYIIFRLVFNPPFQYSVL